MSNHVELETVDATWAYEYANTVTSGLIQFQPSSLRLRAWIISLHTTISFFITTTQSVSTCFDTISTHIRHIITRFRFRQLFRGYPSHPPWRVRWTRNYTPTSCSPLIQLLYPVMQKLVHSYLSKLAVVILKQYLLGIILSTVSQQLAIKTSASRAATVSNSCRTVSNRVDSIGVAIVCAFYTRLSLWLYYWEAQAIPHCISVGWCVRAWHDAKL